ncbi:hypothetical protein ASD21_00570 [Caulobacter sp. Root1455]|uniref:hypothetical protein n=1 Tax=Caulobacter sp. Root1455 TaxID=1736465 RepID=UPI0006F6960D|nr:hypothetical protein [Caulobacter sp. Root1455]KQZ06171.1 hypothetical protein ASD21_00570 [Caulobacter sp. Root1455]
MPLPSDADGPVLRIHYETDRLLDATDLANVLGEIGRAFDRYANRSIRGSGLRLAVRRVEVGSVVADLVVVGSAMAVALVSHRDAIYGFVGFLGDLVSIAQGLKPGKNKAADKRLVDALKNPIENVARQVNIFVVGDGNIVTIDKAAIERMTGTSEAANLQAEADRAEVAENPPAALAAPRFLTLDGKFGTAIDVKGRWYVRLEGEGGVLNPLELAQGVMVVDDQSYRFDGVWEGRSYRIRAARPIGQP